jgi:hypothetical protein
VKCFVQTLKTSSQIPQSGDRGLFKINSYFQVVTREVTGEAHDTHLLEQPAVRPGFGLLVDVFLIHVYSYTNLLTYFEQSPSPETGSGSDCQEIPRLL